MAKITLQGKPINTNGDLPAVGSKAPEFHLTNGDLADVTLADYSGKKKLLNIVPSLDTGVCATSTIKFNEEAKGRDDVVMLIISADLPFAQGRFCTGEKLDNVIPLSMMRNKNFAKDYGVLIHTTGAGDRPGARLRRGPGGAVGNRIQEVTRPYADFRTFQARPQQYRPAAAQ